MKILLVTTELATTATPSGGLGTFVRRFSTALAQEGHMVRILQCSPGPPLALENGVVAEGVPPSYTDWMRGLHTLSFRRLHPAITMLARARGIAFRVSELAQAGEVDVVHASNLGGLSLFHPPGVPLVIRLSSDRMLYRKFGGFDYENWVSVWQQHYLERRGLTRANGIYSPSRRVASVVEDSTGKTVKVIPPPVFLEPIEEDESVFRRTVADTPFLLFVGRVSRLKGIPTLTRILKSLLARNPEIRMVIAGAEHQSLQNDILTKDLYVSASPHSDRVLFTGLLPHTQLIPFLKRAEAVVLPSLVDNLPNSLLEAMLYGKVVIGTRHASFDELITDGLNGILCEPGDPSSLEQAIDRVLTLKPLVKRNIENAARARIAELSPSIVIPRIVNLLEDARASVNRTSRSHPKPTK